MDTREFLALVTPESGLKCLAIQQDKGFAHHFYHTHQDMSIGAHEFDKSQTVFFALSSFKQSGNRRGENVLAVRSFWFDIDCGEGKDYLDQAAAITALYGFIAQTGEQTPLIISSGNGIHCYWPMDRDLAPDEWTPVARKLKALALKLGLKIDPSRTADIASVLRPVGTHHKKQTPWKEVRALNFVNAFQHNFELFRDLIDGLCEQHQVDILDHTRPAYLSNIPSVNENLLIKPTFAPSSAHGIAAQCPQMALIRDTRGDVTEPLWYAGIGLLRHTTEAPQIIHDWSNGHPQYDAAQTDSKIQQHERNSTGPTSCAQFEEVNSSACMTCPHRGKIKSPIKLGTAEMQPAPTVDPASGLPLQQVDEAAGPLPAEIPEHGIEAPFPFRRTAEGLFFDTGQERVGEGDDERDTSFNERFEKFYDYDMYVESIFHDAHVEGEIFVVKHFLPQNGWQTCSIETQSLARIDTLYRALLRNHIKVKPNHMPRMVHYIMGYLQELEKQQRIQELSMSMGWTDDNQFVLGERLFAPNQPIFHAQLSLGIKESFCRYFKNNGDLQEWVDKTSILNSPGMEGHAFALLLGFGAPLMRFTGYSGALVNLVGESNAGKTSMTNWLTSIYGKFSELKAQKGDTVNSMFQRLGVFNNIPFVIDEITNIDGMELSNFVYTVTQGRTKTRLKQSGTERKNNLRWNTIVVSSSNERLANKLGFAKANPEAEQLRLFEYELCRHPVFEKHADETVTYISNNFGTVGERYIQYLVDHHDTITENLEHTRQRMMELSDAQPEERYWYAVIASAIFGGKIAEALGLIQFDVNRVAQYMMRVVQDMRATMEEKKLDYLVLLGSYINEFIQNRLVMAKYGSGAQSHWQVKCYPRGSLFMRVEMIENNSYLYIDRHHLGAWLHKQKLDIDYMERDLLAQGVLVAPNKKKVLGAHWPENPGSGQITTWQIDANHHALGATSLKLVQANETLTQAANKL